MYNLENNVEWTEDLKNAFKHNVTRASILYDESEINENQGLMELTLTEARNVPDMGFIGQATARKLELKLQNTFDPSSTNAPINLENKELITKIGADYDGSTYYINFGNFIVDEPPENDQTNGQVTVVAYDYMIKFNKPYEDRVTYPCTLLTLLQDICAQAGVELATTNFANKNFVVDDNQFGNKTLRDVLQNIAKSAFSWARIGQDNRLYIDFALAPSYTETFTIDDYKQDSFKKANEYYGPINRVIFADSDIQGQEEKVEDAQSIAANGLHELIIYDNLFANTTQKRMELITAGSALFGLTYMPVTQLDSIGTIYLDCNDGISIQTIEGNTYTSRILEHTIKYNGALENSIVTEGSSLNESRYKNTAKNVLQNMATSIALDRAQKRIDLVVSDMIGDRTGKSTTLTMDVDGINSKVAQTISMKDSATGAEPLTLQKCADLGLLELHIFGNNTVFQKTYPAEDLYPGSYLLVSREQNYVRVTDQDGNETLYDLGRFDHLRQNGTVKDELTIIDKRCQIIRRINRDGTIKETPVTEDVGTVNIVLHKGINVVDIPDYTAQMSVTWLIQNEYTENFATELELSSQINQAVDSISTEVRKKADSATVEEQFSTINQTINAIETSVASKVGNSEFSTKIRQSATDVVVAWNNFAADFIKLEQESGTAAINIYDASKRKLTTFNRTGQHFYDTSGTNFANMGVEIYNNRKFVAFSVNGRYDSNIANGMAWGIKSDQGNFEPILYIADFHLDPEPGESYGTLSLDSCDLELSPERVVRIGNVELGISQSNYSGLEFRSGIDNTVLFSIKPAIHGSEDYEYIEMLSGHISFFKNAADSYTFKLGTTGGAGAYMTDDGDVHGKTFTCNDLYVFNSKNRIVKTKDYGTRALSAYETAVPYFGDIGSDKTDENGLCVIPIEEIFKQTVIPDDYKVFIQECGEGKLWVKKFKDYFEVHGTPNLEFDWEIKAIQAGVDPTRLKELDLDREGGK